MGRLIDADELLKQPIDTASYPSNFVKLAPTVEAISKDQYENRLKDDMAAILTELQLEIDELNTPPAYQDEDYFLIGTNKCSELIQQKINKLKGVKE